MPAVGQDPVSFHRDVVPILAANCTGCHHPGKTKGGLVLTSYAAFQKGGKHGRAFEPADPDRSAVVAMIRGPEPEMPAEGDPLTPAEIEVIIRWIREGAKDDTPADAAVATTAPAAYRVAPPNPSIAFSPDGSLLAVAGYHEVILHGVGAGVPIGATDRLVGRAPRIQSLTFSADGKLLAVAGGSPGRFGEIQVWDVARRKQVAAYQVTTDTLFGVSFSPDGKNVAFGCADKTVRMLRVADGEELLRFRNHAEWVLGTCFTKDGKRLVSGGRDKALKIIDLANGRFVDDINNPIEPILALARHPEEDTVVYGGARGTPMIYRISDNQKRTAARNDTNLLRALERQSGAVHAVAFSRDGALVAAGGVDPLVRVQDVKTGKRVAVLRGHTGPVFSIAFHPGLAQPRVATAGFDGRVRFYDARTGAMLAEFVPVPVAGESLPSSSLASPLASALVTGLTVTPRALTLAHGRDARGLLVTGRTFSGQRVDLTNRMVLRPASDHVTIDDLDGFVVPKRKGRTSVLVQAAGLTVSVPVEVQNADKRPAHFSRDVMPILGRTGCNLGTCHGAQDGKNGFALSLRGFDPAGDYGSLVHDLAGRRFDRVAPEQSLMLLKPTGEVPHEGRQVVRKGSRHYEILRAWIAEGTRYRNDEASQVEELSVLPPRLDIVLPGRRQRVLVLARYADGSTADVTRDAILSVSDIEIAKISGTTVTALRRGEAAVLVRYEGRYATAPITVMGDRTGFAWRGTPEHNFIDDHVNRKLERVKTLPAGLCTDAEFVRRLYLDLTGKPPTPEVGRAFVRGTGGAEKLTSREKRERLIDELIGSPAYVAHWSNKWADLLQCNSKRLGEKGVWVFRRFLEQSVAANRPYDAFVRELITANGRTHRDPATNYMRALSDKGRSPDPGKMTEDVTQTFLGVRFGCCKCHNHPFEKWTQDQYYEISAQFAQVRFKNGEEPGELVVYESYNGGEVKHPRTAVTVLPSVPYAAVPAVDAIDASKSRGSRRDRFAAWLTSKDNKLFARSYVNRVWSYFFGVGIIEPVDDIRAGNPPSNPALLDALERSFVAGGFDFNQLVRTICRSHTFQRSFRTDKWNADDKINFSHCQPRRLSAEQLLDAMAVATGVVVKFQGLPEGSSPAEAPDGVVKGNDFLKLFGRPERESACECARTSNLSLAHALNLIGGETLHDAIVDGRGRVAKLVGRTNDDKQVVTELYWAALCRPPTAKELAAFADLGKGDARLAATQDLLWALTNSPAFLFNR